MAAMNELRKMNITDLRKKFHDLDKEIALETFNVEARRSNKTAQLRKMKKERAQIATVITELTLINSIA